MIPSNRSLQSKLLSKSQRAKPVRKNRWPVIGGVLATVALGLGLTNPSKAAYADHFAGVLSKGLSDRCYQVEGQGGARNPLSRVPVKEACKFAVAGATQALPTEKLIEGNTDRTNFVLFSVYATEDPVLLGGKTTKTIGVAGLFVPFYRG